MEVDVRIVSATKKDLNQMVQAEHFRQDLYYRLLVVTIPLPALRQRQEDIPMLIEHFLRQACTIRQIPIKCMGPEAMWLLLNHDWPGNVRELENVVEQAVLLSPGEEIEAQALPRELHARESSPEVVQLHRNSQATVDLPQVLSQVDEEVVQWALAKAGGNQTKAAELLRVPRTTFVGQAVGELLIGRECGKGVLVVDL